MPQIEQMAQNGQLKEIDTLTGTPEFCEPCVLGKMKKLPFHSQEKVQASKLLQIIHSNIGGPISPQSREGYRYWLLPVDDYSCFPWIYFLKKKRDVLSTYNEWKMDVWNFFKQEIGVEELSTTHTQFLRSNGGGEYSRAEFRHELLKDGTLQETSAPYTLEQNGLVERMNQTLSTLANTMLEDSKLPKAFWVDTMSTAAYITGRSLSSALKGGVPYQLLFNWKVNPTLFHPFCCLGYALIPKEQQGGKFQSHRRKCVLLGYMYRQQAYKLFDLEHRSVISSRHVTFNESKRISDANSTPWQNFIKEQWEGLLSKHLHQPEHNRDEKKSNSNPPAPPDISEVVGVDHAPPEPPPDNMVDVLSQHLNQLHLDAPAPAAIPPPAPAPAPAPDPARAQSPPAQIVAGVRRSSHVRQSANRNKDYQCTLDEETHRKAECQEPHPEQSEDGGETPENSGKLL